VSGYSPDPARDPPTIAVLGPGGVGGLIAGALWQAGEPVVIVAREPTAELIEREGLRLSSVRFGELHVHPQALARLEQPIGALIVATKASGLRAGLERIAVEPGLVLPLLNGLDHLAVLRERFGSRAVLAGAIRVEADRPAAGVITHTSPFLRIDMAGDPSRSAATGALAGALDRAGIPARVLASEPEVMWGKLVRLNALACTTSAFEKLLGEIRDTPELRGELIGAIEEGCAVARAQGADIEPREALRELTEAHATLGSSMQRDIAAGREPELDAIPGAILRAGARHDIACPTIERLVGLIARRAGIAPPTVPR
jgi:2-dehydropantoate 2-reductase